MCIKKVIKVIMKKNVTYLKRQIMEHYHFNILIYIDLFITYSLFYRNALNIVKDDLIIKVDELTRLVCEFWALFK